MVGDSLRLKLSITPERRRQPVPVERHSNLVTSPAQRNPAEHPCPLAALPATCTKPWRGSGRSSRWIFCRRCSKLIVRRFDSPQLEPNCALERRRRSARRPQWYFDQLGGPFVRGI